MSDRPPKDLRVVLRGRPPTVVHLRGWERYVFFGSAAMGVLTVCMVSCSVFTASLGGAAQVVTAVIAFVFVLATGAVFRRAERRGAARTRQSTHDSR